MKKRIKVWSTRTADDKFRENMRALYKMCAKCKLPGQLQVSHFWTRNASCVRYSVPNCDMLHYACHYGNLQGWEYQKQGKYREYMIQKLGPENYNALEKTYYQSKMTRREAILKLMEMLNR